MAVLMVRYEFVPRPGLTRGMAVRLMVVHCWFVVLAGLVGNFIPVTPLGIVEMIVAGLTIGCAQTTTADLITGDWKPRGREPL